MHVNTTRFSNVFLFIRGFKALPVFDKACPVARTIKDKKRRVKQRLMLNLFSYYMNGPCMDVFNSAFFCRTRGSFREIKVNIKLVLNQHTFYNIVYLSTPHEKTRTTFVASAVESLCFFLAAFLCVGVFSCF